MRFSSTEKILTAVHMVILKERSLAQGKRIFMVSPVPALEVVTKPSVPNSKALHPRWIQWTSSLTSTDVNFIFDPSLQTQDFLQYEYFHPPPLSSLLLDQYRCIIYKDGSAQPAIGSKHAYSAACAIVAGSIVDGDFKSSLVHTQSLGDCTAQLTELGALVLALEFADPKIPTYSMQFFLLCTILQ